MGGKASKKGKKQPPQQQQQQPLEYDLLSKVLIIGDSGKPILHLFGDVIANELIIASSS